MGAAGRDEKAFRLSGILSLANLPASSTTDARSILVIDSGVGGLSVCQAILAQQPALQIIYFADSAYFPYGLMPEQKLSERLNIIVGRMLGLHQPSLVVLACNTVSTLVLPELRTLYDIPFVGVVPAIKPAAALSQSKKIGLLATPATVNRPYTDKLISDYAKHCQVIKVGSSELVHEAENLLIGQPVSEQVIRAALRPFKDEQGRALVDTVVLGCTHFPLLRPLLAQQLPGVTWADSGEAIANRVSHLLAAMPDINNSATLNTADKLKAHQIYFSKPLPNEPALAAGLKGLGLKVFAFHYQP